MPSEEAAKLIGRLNDGSISSNIGLGREGIVRLSATQGTGDAIHGEGRGLLILELLDQILVLRGIQKGYDGPILQGGGLLRGGRSELHHNVGALPDFLGGDHLGASSFIFGIIEVRRDAGTLFNQDVKSRLDEFGNALRVRRECGQTAKGSQYAIQGT